MRIGGRPAVAAVVVGLLWAAVGCASLGILPRTTSFERHYEAGRYRAAVEAFEADSALQRREDPLFRVGLLFADPSEPFHDPARARRLLERLLELHPESRHGREARGLVALLRRLEEADERLEEANARADRLEKKLRRLKKVHLGEPPDTSGGTRRRE